MCVCELGKQARSILENAHFSREGGLALIAHMSGGYGGTPSNNALKHYGKAWLESCGLCRCVDEDGGRG